VGLGVRFQGLGVHSVWFDEALALGRASAPTVAGTVSGPPLVEPPLYYLLLRAWSLTGAGEVHARALSALLGSAALVLAWRVFSALAGRERALWALALMALSPFQVLWSQQARPYALREVLELGGFLALLAGGGKTRGLAAWALLMGAAAATHFTSAMMVPCHLVFLALTGAGGAVLARAGAMGAAALVPAGLLAWRTREAISGLNTAAPSPAPALELARGVVEQMGAGAHVPAPLATPALALFSGLLVLGLVRALAVRRGRRGADGASAAVLSLGFLPFVILFLSAWAGLIYQPKVRYAFGAHPFLLLALVAAATKLPGPRAVGAGVLLLAGFLSVASLAGLASGAPPALDLPPCLKPLREAAAVVKARARPGDVVLTTSVVVYLPLRYYLGEGMPQKYLSRDPTFTDAELAVLGKPDSLAGALKGARRAWLVISPVHYLEPPGVPAPVAGYLGRWGRGAGEWKLPGVRVLLFEGAP
jgi:hypothetical protein